MPRPSWPAAKIDLLRDLWTRGLPLKVIMARVGFSKESGVYGKVQTLRAQGYDFPRRGRGGKPGEVTPFGVVAGGLCIPTTPGHVIQSARIMDADGRVVATMDPASRKRTAC